jgi:hypothetical protein
MLVESFRLVTARLIPGALRPKQFALVVCLILAGCGGSSEPAKQATPMRVTGPGFSFRAPGGWQVQRSDGKVGASQDSELVQVASFRLLKPYRTTLFDRVEGELSTRMRQLAQQTGGAVSAPRTVTADGVRSHSYTVTVGDHVDEYTFVLRGRREYQLLCRRKASHGDDACRQLLTSFATT